MRLLYGVTPTHSHFQPHTHSRIPGATPRRGDLGPEQEDQGEGGPLSLLHTSTKLLQTRSLLHQGSFNNSATPTHTHTQMKTQ